MEDELKYSYNVLKFDLTAGMSDVEVPIHAQRIDYVSPTDGPEISIRLQRKSNDALPLRPNGSIEAPFTRLYISAAATPKTVFLMVGAPAGVRVTGRDVAISGTINANIVGGYVIAPETAYIEAGTLYSHVRSVTLAAQLGTFQLKNPAGSGKILELYHVRAHCTVAGVWIIGPKNADIAIGTTNNGDDHNVAFPGVSVASVQHLAAASTTIPNFENFHVPANTDRDLPVRWWIPAGTGIGIVTPNMTASPSVTLFWRERTP